MNNNISGYFYYYGNFCERQFTIIYGQFVEIRVNKKMKRYLNNENIISGYFNYYYGNICERQFTIIYGQFVVIRVNKKNEKVFE